MSKPECTHTTIIKNLCSSCGVLIKDNVDSLKAGGRVALLHNVPELLVTKELAHKIGNNDRELLLKSKKLILIVDLDQTIIHSVTIFVRNMQLIDMKKHQSMVLSVVDKDTYFCYTHRNYFQYTFFRKNLQRFFKELEPFFEFHIFTMGTRDYAEPIINFLDPEGRLFGSRIKTRNEFQIENNKFIELKSLFPCTSDLVCIMDDRLDVWCHSDNVLQVYPYESEYALALYEKFNGKLVKPLFKSGGGIVDENTILFKYSDILKKIHYNFFGQISTNSFMCTKKIIKLVRKSIFHKTYTFYVDKKFLKFHRDEHIENLMYKLQMIGVKTVLQLALDRCNQEITHILVDKKDSLSPESRKIVRKILHLNQNCDIKFIKAKWVDKCYFQWKYANEDNYVYDIDRFLQTDEVPINPIQCKKRKNPYEKSRSTDNSNNSSNKALKSTEIMHTPGENGNLCVRNSCKGGFFTDKKASQERHKVNHLSLENNKEENCNKSDDNHSGRLNKNDHKYSSEYYNEEDIESMADELETFLE